MGLESERCMPCRDGSGKLSDAEADSLLAATSQWHREGNTITRRWKFKNFMAAQDFVNRVGSLAEGEGHHPDIAYGWGYAAITFTTHAAHGLTRNDFIMAAKVEALT